MNNDIAINIQGLKKQYRLGQIGGGTLTADLQSWWARVRGKEDPNSKIGTDQRLIGQTFMALNGIDLQVKQGEALGIIGGNGAGKSTMLKILSRITAPTEGSVDIYGRITSMLEVGTGFSGEMTGRENIYMNGAILGMSKAEIDAKMEDIIEFSEVREFIDTPVKRYSSGMYVKLAFSVAAHLDSEIMIMDEVLAVGDMAFQKKCLDKMRDAATVEGKTVLYVSHNMNTIRQLCDRCIVLDKGRVVFEGEVEEAIGKYLNSRNKSVVFEDYSDSEMPGWIDKRLIKLLSADLVGKNSILYTSREPMQLRLKWRNNCDVNHVGLRIEVYNMEGIPQATYCLYDFYSGTANQYADLYVKLDTSLFMDAQYRMIFTFFFKDEYGNNVDIECVHGIHFEKTTADAEHKWVWKARNWGYLQMPRPEIIDLINQNG